ncbi:MAG: ATP-binding protein [Bacteroidota bacterium]
MPDTSFNSLAFLQDGGEMGELIRSIDWSANPLGPPSGWPSALRFSVNMLLNTPLPILICWGEDYIQVYNDAFRPINGESKHPQALGNSARETYKEIWDSIGPLFESVMAGKSVSFENFLVKMDRHGYPEDCYFDFSYSPIRDDAGVVQGIRVICMETTEMVMAQQKLEQSTLEEAAINEELDATNEELAATNEELAVTNEELAVTNQELHNTAETLKQMVKGLAESDERFRNLIREATVGIILLVGPEMKVQIVNDAYANLIGRKAAELYGKNLFDIIPETEPYFRPIIDPVRETGDPVYLYDQAYQVYNGDETIRGFLNLIYQPYREDSGKITGVMVLCQDVTEQVKARQKLEEAESRFRFILNAIPTQVWTATPEGALNYVNQGISNDFGQPGETVVGLGWQEFIHPEDLPITLKNWSKALQSGKEYLNEFRLKFADGRYYWHLARAVPYVEGTEITLWLGTNTNIDQQKGNENKKDEFISIASHELKTPLTTIKAFFQLTKRELRDEEQPSLFLTKAERQMDRLERLIGDLLDVSKINAGKIIYNKEEFDFGKSLADVVDSIQQTTPSHTLELIENCEVRYNGDQHRIEQVLINLLSNAVKYSPGGDRIIINSVLEGTNIIVSVQDFGIGIEEEHLKDLFDRFYRVDNSSSRFQGLGLGLFISADIVKRHGGSFWIESLVGEGSTFYFLLPLDGQQTFADIATDNQTYYEGNYVTIRYRQEQQYIDVDWIGYQNYDSVVKGCQIMLDIMQKNDCHKILNDNTRVKGNWSEASDWGAEIWFPAMARAGLRKFAWIYSPSTFSRIASSKSVPPSYDEVELAFFDDKVKAANWLLSGI